MQAIGYFVAGCLFQAAITYLMTRLVITKVRHQVDVEHNVELEMIITRGRDGEGEEWKKG